MLRALACLLVASGRLIDLEHTGLVPSDDSEATEERNAELFNVALQGLRPGDVLLLPAKPFHLMGGLLGVNLSDVVLSLDGELIFSKRTKSWPRRPGGGVLPCMRFEGLRNVTFTSSKKGTLDGQGAAWWGYMKYLEVEENRPRLWEIDGAKDVLIEKLFLKDAAYWSTWFAGLDGLEIRYAEISNRRSKHEGHDVYNLGALNTDGWDVSGTNVWVHHSKVWNQDDCFTVKGTSSNMIFEDIEASGLGLTIGSEGGRDVVRNITFRNVYMDRTFKGIYLKFNDGATENTSISDITYENIYMKEPEQWAIWIGPAQQSDSREFWKGHPCSLLWPTVPGAECRAAKGTYRNILLRNITIDNPKHDLGVILADDTTPMQNITFDSVRVVNWKHFKSPKYRLCSGVASGVSRNSLPIPSCFHSESQLLV